MWECQILGLASLDSVFSGIQRLSFILGVVNVPSHLLYRGVPFPQALLPVVFVASWGCSDGTGGTWFLVFTLIGIPAVIRDAEHLVLWWRFGSSFFSNKRCEENLPVAVGFLKAGWVWNLFLQFLPQDTSWGRLPYRPQCLRNGGASKRQRCSCSYRKCPQGAALPQTPSGSLGNRSLRATWLPGLWIGVKLAWATT